MDLHVRVRRAAAADLDDVLEGAQLFDRAPDRTATAEFLSREDRHLLIAYVDDDPVGFALGHELCRLDGPRPKLLLYEIGTAPHVRRRGIGRMLIEAMKEVGRSRGALSMFLVTEESNSAAVGLYTATGAVRHTLDEAVFEYRL